MYMYMYRNVQIALVIIWWIDDDDDHDAIKFFKKRRFLDEIRIIEASTM